MDYGWIGQDSEPGPKLEPKLGARLARIMGGSVRLKINESGSQDVKEDAQCHLKFWLERRIEVEIQISVTELANYCRYDIRIGQGFRTQSPS